MDRHQIETLLASLEDDATAGEALDLRAAGFWKAVAAVKRDRDLADEFADRIAVIDRVAFEQWAFFRVGIRAGTWSMLIATAVALGIIGAGYAAPDPWNGLLLLAGTGGLLVTTHGLGHLAVGAAAGIGFTHWFIGSLLRPQPGVKVDYATYLRVPAAARARMHASGALVTKAMPFLMLGAAWGMEAPGWAWLLLALGGAASIITDILWSVGSSDWKRYSRERRLARAGH
jgi:hypothetical protein